MNRRDALKAVACATIGLVTINEIKNTTDTINESNSIIDIIYELKSIMPISTIDVNSITKFMPNTIIVDLG